MQYNYEKGGVMVEKLAYIIISNLAKYNEYNDIQKEQMNYVLRVLLYEISKFILAIIIFSLLGYLKESIIILIYMVVTKPFTGGYHEYSQMRCFIATVIIIGLVIILSQNSQLNLITQIVLSSIVVFCVYNQAPIIDRRMPITKKELIEKNKSIGTINTLVLAMISVFLFKYNNISNIILWISIVQTMLLFNNERRWIKWK